MFWAFLNFETHRIQVLMGLKHFQAVFGAFLGVI